MRLGTAVTAGERLAAGAELGAEERQGAEGIDSVFMEWMAFFGHCFHAPARIISPIETLNAAIAPFDALTEPEQLRA